MRVHVAIVESFIQEVQYHIILKERTEKNVNNPDMPVFTEFVTNAMTDDLFFRADIISDVAWAQFQERLDEIEMVVKELADKMAPVIAAISIRAVDVNFSCIDDLYSAKTMQSVLDDLGCFEACVPFIDGELETKLLASDLRNSYVPTKKIPLNGVYTKPKMEEYYQNRPNQLNINRKIQKARNRL